MTSLICSLFVFLSLCMHACIAARHLALIEKRGLAQPHYFSAKMANSTDDEVVMAGDNDGKGGGKDQELKESFNKKMITKQHRYNLHSGMEHGRSEIEESMSMSKKGVDQSTSPVGSSSDAHVLLKGSKLGGRREEEENINYKMSSSVKGGLVEMDYEPPQRRTPIHN